MYHITHVYMNPQSAQIVLLYNNVKIYKHKKYSTLSYSFGEEIFICLYAKLLLLNIPSNCMPRHNRDLHVFVAL